MQPGIKNDLLYLLGILESIGKLLLTTFDSEEIKVSKNSTFYSHIDFTKLIEENFNK